MINSITINIQFESYVLGIIILVLAAITGGFSIYTILKSGKTFSDASTTLLFTLAVMAVGGFLIFKNFSMGPFVIHLYGVIIGFGAILAAGLATWQAKIHGLDPDMVYDIFPWVLVFGIIGARLWHVFTPSASMVAAGHDTLWYFQNPIEMLKVWNGGLGIPGGVMAGALALWVYTRVKKQSFATWVDVVAPGLALAQAIGRWGNFVNQELYGAPTNLPWKIFIEKAYRMSGYLDQEYYHPLFLYESLWNLMNMGVLLWVGRRFKEKLFPGEIFQLYLIIYPIGRFLLEYLRLDPSNVGALNANQTVMGGIAIASILLTLVRRFVLKK